MQNKWMLNIMIMMIIMITCYAYSWKEKSQRMETYILYCSTKHTIYYIFYEPNGKTRFQHSEWPPASINMTSTFKWEEMCIHSYVKVNIIYVYIQSNPFIRNLFQENYYYNVTKNTWEPWKKNNLISPERKFLWNFSSQEKILDSPLDAMKGFGCIYFLYYIYADMVD